MCCSSRALPPRFIIAGTELTIKAFIPLTPQFILFCLLPLLCEWSGLCEERRPGQTRTPPPNPFPESDYFVVARNLQKARTLHTQQAPAPQATLTLHASVTLLSLLPPLSLPSPQTTVDGPAGEVPDLGSTLRRRASMLAVLPKEAPQLPAQPKSQRFITTAKSALEHVNAHR